MKKYLAISFVFAAALMLGACSKLQNNVLTPVQSLSEIHPAGWTQLTSSDFHGTYLKAHNYDMTTCTSCHGKDLSGGTSQKSCYTCHPGSSGTFACNMCHGSSQNPAPPKDLAGDSLTTAPGVGAHQSHLAGSSSMAQVSCTTCHLVPQAAGPGLHPSGGNAIVFLSGISTTQSNVPGTRFYDATMPTVSPMPTFNPQTLQCSNTYCHGNFKGGNNFSPLWTSVSAGQDSCGSCHGIPPATSVHAGATLQNCYFCHEPMIGPGGVIQDSSMHVNGKLELYGKSVTPW